MDEFQIAKAMANVINRLTYTGDDHDSPQEEEDELCVLDMNKNYNSLLGIEELQLAKLHGLTAELAMSKAKELNQDFETVFKYTQFAVTVQLGKLLAPTVNPVLGSLKKVVIKDKGEICGVCQEEMEESEAVDSVCEAGRGLRCGHVFHLYCISLWLRQNLCCPLCRQKHEITNRLT